MPRDDGRNPDIFICYRREDSGGYARALYERLSAHFGEEQVFMDFGHIEPGADFARVIRDAAGSCAVLIALIGPNWLTSHDAAGRRRLDDPKDQVRLEIAAALAREGRVIPALLPKARMPTAEELPEDLARLARHNAFVLSEAGWRDDVNRFVVSLEKVLGRQRARPTASAQGANSPPPDTGAPPESGEGARQAAARGTGEAAPAADGRARPQLNSPPPAPQEGEPTNTVAPRTGSKRTCLIIVAFCLSSLALLSGGLGLLPMLGTSENRPKPVEGPSNPPDGTPTPQVGAQAPPGTVYVPGGTFMMGRDGGDQYERPAHPVTVGPFFVDRYEVTNEQYGKFVRETNGRPPRAWAGGWYAPGAGHRPVTGVTWDDADAYAKWAGMRLPTEAEWEFAARGTDGRRYPWGDEWRAGLANADGASRDVVDVGSYAGGESPFGASDMVGNAWEWTADDLAPYPRGRLPVQVSRAVKVIRGGSFDEDRTQATATYRAFLGENDRNNKKTGFRCVKDAPAQGQNVR
jgi:serine/threonine-protein kinase